jgi:hypothetical protein
VVTARVMRLAHTHRVVGQVDIAVVAEEFRHGRAVAIAWCSIWRGCRVCIYATAVELSVWNRELVNGVDVKMGELLEVQSPELKAAALASLLSLRPRSNSYIHITFCLAMNTEITNRMSSGLKSVT